MRLEVQTMNTLYQIRSVAGFDNVFKIRGNAQYCPTWTLARVVRAVCAGEPFSFDLLSGPYAMRNIITSPVRSFALKFPVKK